MLMRGPRRMGQSGSMGWILSAAVLIGAMVWSSRFARGPAAPGPARDSRPAPRGSSCVTCLLWVVGIIAVLGIIWAIAASRNPDFFPGGF